MKKGLMAVLAVCATGAGLCDVVWTNDMATIEFNWAGGVKSLKERVSGRELVNPGNFVFMSAHGDLLYPNGFSQVGDELYRWQFGTNGTMTVRAHSFGLGWTYELTGITVSDVRQIYFGWLDPKPDRWVSDPLNGFSDEMSAVILRSYRPEVGMHNRGRKSLFLDIDPALGLVGSKGGIVAGPRPKLIAALRQMAKDGRVYHTDCTGPWALGNERVKGSYLFTEMSPGSSDDWIDLAERGGFDMIHMSNAGDRGHYRPLSVLYPKGYDDFRLCADLIHGAGLRVGMHTLTAGINPRDSWITPVCRPDLMARCIHTLAKPLAEGDTEMFVEEIPEQDHDTFHGYGTRGNTFFYDGELIQYTGFRREKPYAFTGITRGAWRTNKRGTIPAGAKMRYLHQMYDAFYPQPNSKLADEMGDQIAKLFQCGNLDFIYFDGAEGAACPPRARYAIDSLRLGFAKKLGSRAIIEGACTQAPDCWWYLSRYGAWDHALWGAKLFQDQHSRDKDNIRLGTLVEPQMGWWKPRQADSHARGHFLDEMEYFAKRNAADDAAMSLQGVDMRRQHITPPSVVAQMTVLGWYERFRLAHAFTAEALDLFRMKGVDARLRQGVDGRWYCRRSDATVRRVTGVGDGSETFAVKVPAASPAAIRVEALYNADRSSAGVKVLEVGTPLEITSAGEPRVEAGLGEGESAHGKTFVLTASNRGGTLRGSWAQWKKTWTMPYFNAGDSASFGFWVKGDGKGETLCLQVCNGREYGNGLSDHYVKIDFAGWRYVELLLRERDAGRIEEFVWPHSKEHNMKYIGSATDPKHLASVSFLLNDVPVGGTVQVEVTSVVGKPVVKCETRGATVVVNGQRREMPFALFSGDYAELDGRTWVKYSEKGVPVARAAAEPVELIGGDNSVSYEGRVENGVARAEISVFALGKSFPATKDIARIDKTARRRLAYEAELPVRYQPAVGFDGRIPVLVRPNEKAFLELRVTGPVAHPSLTVKDGTNRTWTFPVVLTESDRLFCRDGHSWYVLRRKTDDSSTVIAKGMLDEPLPVLVESCGFVAGSSDAGNAAAQFDVVKRYTAGERHPNLARKYMFGQGETGAGETEGILNSNWKAKEK